MFLAPIVLFVYNRPFHTQQTVEALKKNYLSKESELFIYSDGAKNDIDKQKVDEVRAFISTIQGFKKITIIERNKNFGLADSIIDGVTSIVNQYKKVIVLEDDIITSPYFLEFMNQALDLFKENKQVFSISGYSYLFTPLKSYTEDIFLFYRSSSWGWATWKKEWNKVDFSVSDYEILLSDKVMQRHFNRGGDDLFEMLKMQKDGEIDSWAIRFAYSHFIHNGLTLYPTMSLASNIGHDDSGTHCIQSSHWDVFVNESYLPKLNENIDINPEMIKHVQKFFTKSLLQKVKHLIRKLLK